MKFTIGQKIKEVLLKSGITQVYFADQIGMSRRNLERFFERDDISVHQLVKASEILNYDFVKEYLENSGYKSTQNNNQKIIAEKQINYIRKKEVTVQLNIKGEIILISKYFPEILEVVRKEAELRGLSIV